jgi:hypothetical protein
VFRRHYRNQVLAGRTDEVWLAYPDGSAALTVTGVGKGAAAFVNIPVTPDAGDFAGSPVLPSLMHETLRLLRKGAAEQVLTPGFAWSMEVPTASEAAVVTDPAGQACQAQAMTSGRITRLALPAPRQPGAYLATRAGAVVGAAVVNVDARESDTRNVALEKLGQDRAASVVVMRDEGDLLSLEQLRPLWPGLAVALAVLVALEMILLAWWRRVSTVIKPAPAAGNAR